MKTGVTILSTKYYTNDRTTVCVIKAKINRDMCYSLYVQDIFKRVTKGLNIEDKWPQHIGEFTVVGKSVCHPGDTYTEVLGKRIAESRAKRKLFILANKFWKRAENLIMDKAKESQKLSERCAELKEIEVRHLSNLLYRTEYQ